MLTLQEVKVYLRIDHNDEDRLLKDLMQTAKKMCMDVGRMSEERFAMHEETTRQAMLYTISYLYENRNNADYRKLTLTLRALLFAQREGVI